MYGLYVCLPVEIAHQEDCPIEICLLLVLANCVPNYQFRYHRL